MLEKYTGLLEEYKILKDDYASEREIRRTYQTQVQNVQHEVAETRRELVRCLIQPCATCTPANLSQESNSFVLALIDGDGVIVRCRLV